MADVAKIVKGIIAQQFEMPVQEVGRFFVVIGKIRKSVIVNALYV